jgi:hypothetical protein
MALLDNTVLDAALDVIRDDCTQLFICSSAPTTFTHASAENDASGYKLGTKAITEANIQDCADRTGGGRMIEIDAIIDGAVEDDGTAGFWAICSATVLLAAGALSATQSVTDGNTFTLDAFEIGLGDPT